MRRNFVFWQLFFCNVATSVVLGLGYWFLAENAKGGLAVAIIVLGGLTLIFGL